MIFLDNLGGLKRGRFWYNQIPFRVENRDKALIGSFQHPNVQTVSAFQLCCEIALLPRDINNYGLLGLEFSPIEGDFIQYEIPYLDHLGESLDDNVALKTDRVFIGIPREFAVVIKEVMEQSKGSEIPVGKYLFVVSAHGVVGSSRAVFSKLASVLLQLAKLNPNVLDIATMKSVIADEIKKT